MVRTEMDLDETLNSYLYRAVHNGCIQFLRQQKVRNQYNVHINAKLTEAELIPYEWVSLPYDPAEVDEIHRLYRQALEQLPGKTCEIFIYSRETKKNMLKSPN